METFRKHGLSIVLGLFLLIALILGISRGPVYFILRCVYIMAIAGLIFWVKRRFDRQRDSCLLKSGEVKVVLTGVIITLFFMMGLSPHWGIGRDLVPWYPGYQDITEDDVDNVDVLENYRIYNRRNLSEHGYYTRMAEALLDGRFDIEVGGWDRALMNEMEADGSLYDPVARKEAGLLSAFYVDSTEENMYLWDLAYHNGKYYLYFGIVPCLLLFLPWMALTGTAFPGGEGMATFVFVIAALFGFMQIERLFYRRYKPGYGLSLRMIMTVGYAVGSLWCATQEPALYNTAVSCAVALNVWSFYCLYRACESENRQVWLWALAGGVLTALSFGARPSTGLAFCMFCLFLWVRRFRTDIQKGLKVIGVFLLPFIPVAVGLMWYNQVRFGSPFDFGIKYMLTKPGLYDIQYDSSVVDNLVLVFCKTFLKAGNSFSSSDSGEYYGVCGMVWYLPMLFAGVALLIRKRKNHDFDFVMTCVSGVIMAVVMLCMDYLLISVYTPRYAQDFMFLLALSSMEAVYAGHDVIGRGVQKIIARAEGWSCVMWGVTMCFLAVDRPLAAVNMKFAMDVAQFIFLL